MLGRTETRVGIFVLVALGIFFYMGFHIGAFRFDRRSYNSYIMYFKDISGVSRKAEVKIAGVKVGWVENIELIENGKPQAQALVKIHEKYYIFADAHGIVRQDGLLGTKYIEIMPGDSMLSKLEPGSALSEPATPTVSFDELMQKFKTIATNVEEITDSFKDTMGGVQGREHVENIISNLDDASKRISSFSSIIDRSLTDHQEDFNDWIRAGGDLRRLVTKFESQTLPTLQESLDKISDVFERDFGSVATRFESTARALEEASTQAREGLTNLNSVGKKIDEGKGLLGKLVNEDDTYKDMKIAVSSLKDYFTRVQRMQIVFDGHGEYMQRPTETFDWEEAKGYFDIRIHPNDDYFYIIQLVSSDKGFPRRVQIQKEYLDRDTIVDTNKLDLTDGDRVENIFTKRIDAMERDKFRIGIQFAKVFDSIALRFGLFDGTVGGGVDFDIPFPTDKVRWVTSIEAYDFMGRNRPIVYRGCERIEDRRPHLKWLNRMFMFRNIYMTFGADDFASRDNANAFFGFGLRFGDDDVKQLLTTFGSNIGSLVANNNIVYE